MLEFIVSYWQFVLTAMFDICAFVCFIITFVRTGNIKKSISNLKEVSELKYKTIDSDRKGYVQSFTPEVKDYILNPASGELEELPKPKNIDDYIQSHIETCLERCLERFLPKNVTEDDLTADYTDRVDDLASLGEAIEIAEGYREQFGLPDSASIADIYAAVDKSAKELKSKLSAPKPDKKVNGGNENA